VFVPVLRFLVFAALVAALPASAQAPAAPKPDPAALLAAAKEASGGAAWDALRTQHSTVRLTSDKLEGRVDRWSDIETGRSVLQYAIGPLTGAAGFDGKTVWTQEGTDPPKTETGTVALELAANAAYRDRLAFWYPQRAKAAIEYKERAEVRGHQYDVVMIVPLGGRAFEFWISAETHLIEFLSEREADVTRTEVYSEWHEVQGVKIPYHVRTSRGDPKFDEVVDVQRMVFNEPLTNVAFGPPSPKEEFIFPAEQASVEVPFEALNGHIFVRVMLNGRGPFRMLFDAGGANVLSTSVATILAGEGRAVPKVMAVASTMINGAELTGQRYTVADIEGFLRRVEGLDDVAGVIGLEWFVRLPVKVDYARSRLTFYDPSQFKYAGNGTRVAVAARGRLPQVRGSIDGTEGSFDIDTGSRGSLTLSPAFVAKNDLAKRYVAKNVAITGAGAAGPVRAALARGKMLKLGSVEVPNPVIAMPKVEGEVAKTDVAGNVGYGILRQFAVTYDLPNDALYFERYLNFGTPDIADRGGLWLERADDGFKVIDVVAGGPAATAGLKAGDVIVEVNGFPWAQTPLPAVRDAMRLPVGSRVRVKTSTGNDVTIVLRDLV